MHDGPNPGEFSLTKLRAPRLVAMRLHEVEGNPLSPDQIAMIEMFERENWSADRRRAYILAEAMPLAAE